MKRYIKQSTTILLVLLGIFVSSCKDEVFETFLANSPVYMSYEDLRQSVKTNSPRAIEAPGKIYFKDDYVFINELSKGVHIIDVSDPSNPNNIGFIDIPGNVDIAIKEDVLYADNYVDLVAIDVSDLNQITEIGRIEDVFPYTIPEYDTDYRVGEIDQDKGVVIDWEVKKLKQEVEQYYYPIYYTRNFSEKASMDFVSLSNASGVGGGVGTSIGVGGSMARFGLYKDYLYTVGESELYIFNILDMESPVELKHESIGWNVETMFIYNDHMFFGTTSGMLVYRLEIEQNPAFVNQYSHITSCDPVIIKDDLAYVTLHDGGNCGRSVNRLDVIQMNDDYTQLDLLVSYPMANPHGLGIDGDILFICDGDAGLKVFDAGDPEQISSNKIAEFPDINTYDVIPLNDFLFMVGDGGFYLYDYSDLQNIHLLSSIPVATGGV